MSADVEPIPGAATINIHGRMYSDIISKGHQFDPQSEKILYGDDLRDGMRVLVEPQRRNELGSLVSDDTHIVNRWCTVTRMRIEQVVDYAETREFPQRRYSPWHGTGSLPPIKIEGIEKVKDVPPEDEIYESTSKSFDDTRRVVRKIVRFIGVYDDGLQTVRSSNAYDGWVVKKDSVPTE